MHRRIIEKNEQSGIRQSSLFYCKKIIICNHNVRVISRFISEKSEIEDVYQRSTHMIVTLFDILEEKGIKCKTLNALEVFGRRGDWQTIDYANKVKSLEVWEIDGRWENDLKKNLPMARIKILDSVKTIIQNENLEKFDLIVIDNPMNLFGSTPEHTSSSYCEHFDIIKKIGELANDRVILIFNVNKRPYDYSKFPAWKERRQEFYGAIDTANMSVDFLACFYDELFRTLGFKTLFHIIEPRNEFVDYFLYCLKKTPY